MRATCPAREKAGALPILGGARRGIRHCLRARVASSLLSGPGQKRRAADKKQCCWPRFPSRQSHLSIFCPIANEERRILLGGRSGAKKRQRGRAPTSKSKGTPASAIPRARPSVLGPPPLIRLGGMIARNRPGGRARLAGNPPGRSMPSAGANDTRCTRIDSFFSRRRNRSARRNLLPSAYVDCLCITQCGPETGGRAMKTGRRVADRGAFCFTLSSALQCSVFV